MTLSTESVPFVTDARDLLGCARARFRPAAAHVPVRARRGEFCRGAGRRSSRSSATVPLVPRIAPALPHLVPDPFGGNGEGGHALGAASVGQRELAVGQGLLAGLGERDQPGAAESDIAPPASDRKAWIQLRVPVGLTTR